MAGFVECLDNEEAEEGTEKEDGKSSVLLSNMVCEYSLKTIKATAIYTKCHAQSLFFFLTDLPDSDSQKKVARICHETQIHILNLLITSLELKPPNLALYLLGYEVKKPVSSTNLQDPGHTTAAADTDSHGTKSACCGLSVAL